MLLLLSAHGLHAQLITSSLPAEADAYVSSSLPNMNYGAASTMESRIIVSGGTTSVRRIYIRFNLSTIPANAIIIYARMRLYVNNEGADTANTGLVLQRCLGPWTEPDIAGSLTFNNQPANETSDAINTSLRSGNHRLFDVTSHVSSMVRGLNPNFGWSIRRSNEISATVGRSYFTKEHTATLAKPALEIQYYVPFKVTAAAIVHTSSLSASDGSIQATVTGGPGGNTYQWYNGSTGAAISGATSTTLTGLTHGWYGLKISGSQGNPVYMGFVVGTHCEQTSISFDPGPNYIDDAITSNQNVVISATNYGNSNSIMANNWTSGDWYHGRTLLKFNLWVDPTLEINKADMTLFGREHNPLNRPNTAEFLLVTQPWEEFQVTHNTLPATSTSIMTIVPVTSSATENKTIDVRNFWTAWKSNNTTNYGVLFQLPLYNNVYTRQVYHSSDGTLAAQRPNIQFKVTRPCYSYSQLKKELDAGYALTVGGTLRFYFDETYMIAPGKYLPLKIYGTNHQVLAYVTLEGTVVTGTIVPQAYTFDDNRRTVSLTSLGLVNNQQYILEAETSKGEKRYLKFIYKN